MLPILIHFPCTLSLPLHKRPMTTPGGSSSWSHDVFLSFRGPDTRHHFIGHLRKNLGAMGMRTFIDDEDLDRGEQITPGLLKAIEGSRISIIVFSENYASSEWCLEELAHILHCKQSKQQKVYPVFYKVTPSNVRNQNGSFGEAFAKHECRHESEKLLKWKGALVEASGLAGWSYLDGYEYESKFIATIVKDIYMQVCSQPDYKVAHYGVGIECRLKELIDLFDIKSTDVRMIGIWGPAGIGKTTIAKAVHNSISNQFDGGCCFLENIGKESIGDSVRLRKMVLLKILKLKESDLKNEDCEGTYAIKNRLNTRKVLVILDDLDQLKHLRDLVGETEWFGSGSRIVITTRDKRLLISHGLKENQIYRPKELDEDEALELFCKNAFPHESLPDHYAELSEDVLKIAQGLPLALEYLGESLNGRSVEEWKEELQSLRKSLGAPLYESLRRSYNALEPPAKEVFLDIACFFQGKLKSDVIELLGSDHKPETSIRVLREKALINIQNNCICMHNLLEVLGKHIVHTESPSEPGERSRLWFLDDVYDILSEGRGTNKIKGVIVCPSPDEMEIIELSETCFSGMTNLKYFISRNADFSGDIACLPNELRLIDWPKFPFVCLPLNYVPRKLVKLNIPHGRILQLGKKFKRSRNLKYINLEGCKSLTGIPNFAGFPNLRDLNLNYCTSLYEVDDSVGNLGKLVYLSLSGCHNLVTFPKKIRLTSVKRIILRDCKNVTALPDIEEEMNSLTWLDLSGTGIKELSDASIRQLKKLEEFSLRECQHLTSLPKSIYELPCLRYLDLNNCSNLQALPEWNADVCKTAFKLQSLNLGSCKQLLAISELPPTVEWVNAADCVQLESFAKLSNIIKHKKEPRMIERITLYNCHRLCDSLISDMAETKSHASLCSLFLCCWQSEFEVVFPGSEVPEWFTHRKLKDLTEESRFSFEISPNLGNRGLAICAAAEVVERNNPEEQDCCSVTATIDITGGSKLERVINFERKFMKSSHLWLCYIPFIISTGLPSPPFTCGVTLESQGSVQCTSYGVHLVMS